MQDNTSSSLIDLAISKIKEDIICGALAPDQKLSIIDLKQRYDIGPTPLREALGRLVSAGFVTFDAGRGFRTAPMSHADLDDLTRMRELVEADALKRSIDYAEDEWQLGIVTAFAKLKLVQARHGVMGDVLTPEIESAHKQFHIALISGCKSPRLISVVSNYHDQTSRYRHTMFKHAIDLEHFVQVHEALMNIVLSKNQDAAAQAILTHLRRTREEVYPQTVA